jgi:hypothetical protein
MHSALTKALITATTIACLTPAPHWAQTPKRDRVPDLVVELRQIKEGEAVIGGLAGGAYTAGTADQSVDFAPQQVRVRSGDKATLQINQSIPMQWIQKVESQSASLAAAGASASSNTGGVTQALTWMEAGQSLTVTPQWSGGKQPVQVDIEVQSMVVDERTGSDLPATSRQRYSASVTAPLNLWVTIAASGRAPQTGSYNSKGTSDGRRLTQIRVTAD